MLRQGDLHNLGSMKRTYSPIHIGLSLLLLFLAACGSQGPSTAGTSQTPSPTAPANPTPTNPTNPGSGGSTVAGGKTVGYQSSEESFLNPERGFRPGIQLMGGDNLAAIRANGSSVVQAYISLQGFKNGPISDSYLGQMRSRLKGLRDAGLKASVRFWYSWGGESDAPKSVILNHIQQLKPILGEYADVIMLVQAGFIGAWGEWGGSSYDMNSDANRREMVTALINALPKDRKVQLRTVGFLKLFLPNGMTESQASDLNFVGSRLGHHNDCFMVNQSDAGTYTWSDPGLTNDRSYLQSMVRYMPIGGEMCGDVPEAGSDPFNRRTPQGQLAEFERFGWSFISNDFGPVDRWRSWGIYDTLAKRLGYRLSLVQSAVSPTSNGRLQMSFDIKNTGFAAPFNPRLVRIVLRNTSSKQTYPLDANVDVRRWYAGTTQSIKIDQALPQGISAGSYELLLHLADPYATLTNRPEYAIRLANTNVWEANTGYNKLGQTLEVK